MGDDVDDAKGLEIGVLARGANESAGDGLVAFDDRALAAVAGIDVGSAIRIAWLISGALAGLAGVLAALVEYSFDPNFGFQLLLPVFAAVVLGGIGSPYGALACGLVLGVAKELSTWSGFAGGVNPVYKPVVAFVVLSVALLLRPQGFFGHARVA